MGGCSWAVLQLSRRGGAGPAIPLAGAKDKATLDHLFRRGYTIWVDGGMSDLDSASCRGCHGFYLEWAGGFFIRLDCGTGKWRLVVSENWEE